MPKAAIDAIHDDSSVVIWMELVFCCNCGRKTAEYPVVKPAEIVARIGPSADKIYYKKGC